MFRSCETGLIFLLAAVAEKFTGLMYRTPVFPPLLDGLDGYTCTQRREDLGKILMNVCACLHSELTPTTSSACAADDTWPASSCLPSLGWVCARTIARFGCVLRTPHLFLSVCSRWLSMPSAT